MLPTTALEPKWPDHGDRPVVFLIDAVSSLERRMLLEWIERHKPQGLAPGAVEHARLPRSRRRPQSVERVDPRLQMLLLEDDDNDPLFVPLRVVWMVPERDGRRAIRPADLVKLGDPRDPDWLRQRWYLRTNPERARIVAGAPATASELQERWHERRAPGSADDAGLPAFVSLQGLLALEREERRLRGNRYKVPKFVSEDLLSRRAFKVGLHRIVSETKWPEHRVPRKAVRYLKEIAATHSPYVIDLIAHFTRFLIKKSYRGQVNYDPAQLEAAYASAGDTPLIFLPTHKTYIDTLILQHVLYENDYPPNHTAGGINMSFFPVGPIVRRSGVFFIRRTFGDNVLYKFVLRQYMSYLIEKRFPLEWYIEGGRSRTGKLREPRFGLLGYAVDAMHAGASSDLQLVPVSIAYDQIQDVFDYAAELSGGGKGGENWRRLIEYVRAMRRPHGGVHLRMGEPFSVVDSMGPMQDAPRADQLLAVKKLAFAASVRINEVTPITPASLVTLVLLGHPDRALTAAQVAEAVAPYTDFIGLRGLPTTETMRLATADRVAEELHRLVTHGVVTAIEGGPQTVYTIAEGRHMAAAYYRNTVVHFFVEAAMVELGLLAAGSAARPLDAFWGEVQRMRDLFKFDFFFHERTEFRDRIEREVARHEPQWKEMLEAGNADRVLAGRPLRTAPWVLRPFLESYQVIADTLVGYHGEPEEKAILAAATARGRQYVAQRRLHSPESLASTLLQNALRLASNRGLTAEDTGEQRKAFAASIDDTIAAIDTIAG
jgi:glycerol-3-phosphate O-acyltransferase